MTTYSQPIHKSDEGIFNTQSGAIINLIHLDPSQIRLADIAQSLANVCRFGGHLPQHYSVAEHTLLVWHLCPDAYKKAALLHDASEAYLGDVIKPLKVLLGDVYKKLEDRFTEAIFKKYDVPMSHLKAVKRYDLIAVELEHEYFRKGKIDLIVKQNEYRSILGWYEKPEHILLNLMNQSFLQKDITKNHLT